MSWLFGNQGNDLSPVEEPMRQWIDGAFLWLMKVFGEENIKNRKVLCPDFKDFSIKYNGEYQSLLDTSKIIAGQMEINPDDIFFDVYTEGIKEINTGAGGYRIFMQNDEKTRFSAGMYWGRQEDGKYHVAIEKEGLSEPAKLIATIAHEFSHIKLLGEKRITKNNEPLTELVTIVFGLGVFNANSAFQFKRTTTSWGYSKMGYLSQMEWGYALALFAHIRKEETPSWLVHLDRSIKADFKQSRKFILKNPDKVFRKEKN